MERPQKRRLEPQDTADSEFVTELDEDPAPPINPLPDVWNPFATPGLRPEDVSPWSPGGRFMLGGVAMRNLRLRYPRAFRYLVQIPLAVLLTLALGNALILLIRAAL